MNWRRPAGELAGDESEGRPRAPLAHLTRSPAPLGPPLRHPEPKPSKMEDLLKICERHKIPFDGDSAGAIQASLDALRAQGESKADLLGVVTMLATKPMQLAVYFATGEARKAGESCGRAEPRAPARVQPRSQPCGDPQ